MSATSPLMVRKRGAKVNLKQKKILLQSMADNPLVYSRKITADFTINHHKAFWRNMCAVLNIYGPPKKTVESWKKAWKDIRARYQKMGVDLKEIISSLKCDHVIDAKILLDKADQIFTLTKGKVDIEQALRETILSEETSSSEFFVSNMNIAHLKGKLPALDNISEVKLDENRSLFNLVDDNEEIESDDLSDVKVEKSDEDDLCEIAYEEVLESDIESLNYSDTTHSGASLKRKLGLNQNSITSTDESEQESEEEILMRNNSVKKSKLFDQSSSSNTFPASSSISHKTEPNNIQNSSVLNDLLAELRQHNKIQSEKLTFDKTRFETKKQLLEQSLIVKKDIAEAHKLLAKSIKTFIDNISFNT